MSAAPTIVLLVAICAALSGCAHSVARLTPPPGTAVAHSGGPNTSMVFLARVDTARIIMIDLGWWGAEQATARALRDLGASPSDVTDVFLTHSHRDHVGAWRLVRGSRFHLAAGERPAFTGADQHRGWIPRAAEWLKPSDLPAEAEVAVRPFAADTAFIFGADTLFAYLVPGHTAGSAAYLFRGVLFVGDAATHTRWGGFGSARRGYSDDAAEAAQSLGTLWRRLPAGTVRHVCTAHDRCAPFTAEFLRDIAH